MKTAWIKSLLTHLLPLGVKALPCALIALAGLAQTSTLSAETVPTPVYTWDGTGGTASGETVYTKPIYTVENKVINTADAGLTIPSNNFTFSYWAKMTNGANWRNYAGFSDTTGGLMIQKSGGSTINIYSSGSVGNISPNCQFTLSSETPQWLTFVSQEGTLKVYVDGVYVSETTPTNWPSFATSSSMTYFGLGIAPNTSGGSAGNGYIPALIGDARIYDVALTAEQVKAVYDAYEDFLPQETVTVTGDVAFSALGIEGGADSVVTLVANSDVTITMDQALVAHKLYLNGSGKITFVGANKIEASLAVNTNADIAAIPARLDAITVATGKTLNVDLKTSWKSSIGDGQIVEVDRDAISFYVNSGYGNTTFNAGTQYGWASARTNGSVWNELGVANPKDKDGITLASTAVTINAKGGNWRHAAPAQLGGVTRDYCDGQWNLTLSGVPYSNYAVVLYMATDNTGKTWGPVKVTSGSTETFYSYDANKMLISGDGVTVSSTWGDTAIASGCEGVDVMVIPNLSGEVSLLTHGTSGTGDAVRGGLFAMQIINTGTSEIVTKEYTASSDAMSVTLSEVTWNETPFEPTALDSATLTLPDGAMLTIDDCCTLAKLTLVCEGSITITASGEAPNSNTLTNIGLVECSGVTGTVTYAESGYYSAIPFAKLAGVDVIKKIGASEWTPGNLSALAGRRLEITNGTMVVNTAMQSVIATAETPVLVTGATATLKFNADQNYNRMPNDGYVKATNGGTIELTGVNLFNGDHGPHIVLDGGILKTTATGGGHIKVNSVTLSNGSKIQLSRAATSFASEGLVIRTGEDSKVIALAGVNTIEYRDDGSANNTLYIDGGVLEVAAGATLDVKVPVTAGSASITKVGEGTLLWNGSTAKPIVISAGELVFNADATPTNTFSGAGTLVADGAELNLTGATFSCPVTAKNGGALVLTTEQVGTFTVPAGCTLKIKVASYNEVALTGISLADETATVLFVLPNGREVDAVVTTEEGVTTVTLPSQKAFVWSPIVDTKWSTAGNWVTEGEAMTAAPTPEELTRWPVIIELPTDTTLDMDVAANVLDLTVYTIDETTHVLTVAGENVLTIGGLVADDKVIVAGQMTINGGTAEAPGEVGNVLEVTGTLKTTGVLACSAVNTISASGTLEVVSGETTFNLAALGLSGTFKVASGATLKNGTNDGPNYNGSPTLDIAGTLEVIGSTRWSLPENSTMTLREGALLKGAGDTSYNYAYDWFSGDTITVKGNATIAGNVGSHNGGTITFDVAEGKVLTLSGKFDGGVNEGTARLKATGAGTLKITGTTNTYTGGTTVDAGATLEANTIDNLPPVTGLVTVNGRLRFVNAGNTNHSASESYATTDGAPRLVGSGVLEIAGASGYYALPAGFTTPLAFENNRTNGVVVTGAPGITIGTLSGSGYFRADWGNNSSGGSSNIREPPIFFRFFSPYE